MNPRLIQKTVYKVNDFLSWQRIGSLVLSPAFQRRPVWPVGAKSLLIDSVVRGIPMPIIFLRELTNLDTLEPLRQVVDGQQRLRTLLSFIEPAILKDFDPNRDAFLVLEAHNPEIADKSFRLLPGSIRKAILDYEFSVHVLPSDTDDRDVLQIFARMNATGFKLNDQELRNAKYYGYFKKASYELAYEQLSRWRNWQVFSETDIARMIEVEETSDLMITMLQGIHGRRQELLEKTYKDLDSSFPKEHEVRRRFHHCMDVLDDEFGLDMRSLAFRRKALFNTLFCFIYDLIYGLDSELKTVKPRKLPSKAPSAVRIASAEMRSSELPDDLAKVLRGATSDIGSRRKRLDFLRQVFERVEA